MAAGRPAPDERQSGTEHALTGQLLGHKDGLCVFSGKICLTEGHGGWYPIPKGMNVSRGFGLNRLCNDKLMTSAQFDAGGISFFLSPAERGNEKPC